MNATHKALLRIHAAVFIWGFTGVLGRAISLNEAWLVAWRMIITVSLLWPILLLMKKIVKVPLKSIFQMSAIGMVLALHWLTFYGSIKYSNVSIALTCLATSGLMSAILEPLFLKKAHRKEELGFGLLALAGIALIYAAQLELSTGIYLGLIAALLTTLVSILNKKYISHHPPATITIWQLSGALLMSLLLLPVYETLFPSAVQWPLPADWIWLGILAVLCTITTFFLYIYALKELSAFTVSFVLTLEPVYGVLLAFIFYQEQQSLGTGFYSGFGLILSGVVLHTLWMRKFSGAKEKVHFE